MDEYSILVEKLIRNGGRISEEEAMEYLGEEIVSKIYSMLDFCRQDGFQLLLHGCDVSSAENIMARGYKLGNLKEISQEEFLKNVQSPSLENLPENGIVYEDITGDISDSISIEYEKNKSAYLKKDLNQHFTGYMSFSDLVGRFIAHNYGVPCGAMVFVLYPDFVSEEKEIARDYYGYSRSVDDFFDDSFYLVQRMPRGIVLGYLDVKEKELVINPHFSFHTLGEENRFFQTTSMRDHPFSNYVLDEQLGITNNHYSRR